MGDHLILGKRYEYNNDFFDQPLDLGFIKLYQVGELFCESGFQVEPHNQTVYEISYIVTGKGTFITNGKECPVAPNDIYINRLNQMHAIRADRGVPLRYCYLAFAFCEEGMDSSLRSLQEFYSKGSGELTRDNKDLLILFTDIFRELQTEDLYYLKVVENCVSRIIIDACRLFRREALTPPFPAFSEHGLGSAVYTVVRYIDQHYKEITDIRAVAKELGYSYTYLAHVFKEKMDMTIGNYIIKKKMEEAKELLRTGRMNVSQVAERLNYMSVQSFSNSFKKANGISPVEFLNSQQRGTGKSETRGQTNQSG